MKWWRVDMTTCLPGPSWPADGRTLGGLPNPKDGRDVGLWVKAADTKSAARIAIDRVKLRDDELLHTVHVGRPLDKKP